MNVSGQIKSNTSCAHAPALCWGSAWSELIQRVVQAGRRHQLNPGGLCKTLGVGFPGSLAQLLFYMCSRSLKSKTLKSFVLLNVPKVHPLTLGENSVMNLYIQELLYKLFVMLSRSTEIICFA